MHVNRWMRQNMKDHFSLYLFVSTLFLTGIVFGALLVNALSTEQKQAVSDAFGQFIAWVDQDTNFSENQPFISTFSGHLKWILMIWLLGLSVIGLPLILVLDFLKGVLVGFTTGYLVARFSWEGILFVLVSIVPQNLVILPAMMMISVFAIAFSLYLIRRLGHERKGSFTQSLSLYAMQVFALIFLIFLVSLYELYLTPYLMGWVAPMLEAST